MTSITNILTAAGSARTACLIRYISKGSHPRIFFDCGAIGEVFGAAEVERMDVGDQQPGDENCTAWWPVSLDGEVIGELREDDAVGFSFRDPRDEAGLREGDEEEAHHA